MQFKVPQFIDMESKVVGNFTFKQAIYLGGGAGMAFVSFKLLPIFLSIPIIIATSSFAGALTFYPKKKYGKTFIELVWAAIQHFTKSKLYVWKREDKNIKLGKDTEKVGALLSIPNISGEKLSNASNVLAENQNIDGIK